MDRAPFAKIAPLMASSVYSRTLHKAAEILGSRAKLCRELKVPAAELDKWMADKEVPPQSVFLRAVDIVVEDPSASSEPGDPPSPKDASPGSRPGR